MELDEEVDEEVDGEVDEEVERSRRRLEETGLGECGMMERGVVEPGFLLAARSFFILLLFLSAPTFTR